MNISSTDARGLYTKMLVAKYSERTAPKGFLRSFFINVESASKELSIEVQRGTEKIAVDVERGTEGNRNSFSRSTEKIFVPPLYSEYFDATQLDLYDRLFTEDSISAVLFASFIETVAEKLGLLQDKIERAYELQCAQVMETGIVTLNAGINIDFKRKALSLVDASATPWTGAYNPYTQLEVGANFLRTVGKSQGATVNVIMGSLALSGFLGNATVLARNDIKNYSLDELRAPQRDAIGFASHGKITIGSYEARIFTYPEFYDNEGGTSTPYIHPKKVIMLPESPKFVMGFAAVPQLLTEGQAVKKGAFVFKDFMDQRKATHDFGVESAGVAIPVAVDQIWTSQVIA